MAKALIVTFVISALFAYTYAGDALIQCSKKDPNIEQCIIKEANKAMPLIIKGSNYYKIPRLSPLDIPRIEFQANDNLNVDMTNVKIYGLESAVVKGAKIDFNKHHIQVKVYFPRIELDSDYDIKGRILILNLSGKGPLNITFVDGHFNYDFNYKLVNKNGKNFAQATTDDLNYTASRIHFHLGNLFNGNQALTEQTNLILNQNWQEVSKDIAPAVAETIRSILKQIISQPMEKVAFDDVFLP